MIKIEVNTEHEQIGVKSEVKGTRGEIIAEIYAMLRSFEENYSSELTHAVTLLCERHKEKMNG